MRWNANDIAKELSLVHHFNGSLVSITRDILDISFLNKYFTENAENLYIVNLVQCEWRRFLRDLSSYKENSNNTENTNKLHYAQKKLMKIVVLRFKTLRL